MHAHITIRSRDCDGEYHSGHTDQPTYEEQASEFADLDFKHRVIRNTVSLHAEDGHLTVTPEGASWFETTDEGFRQRVVEWCEDDCVNDTPWQRDLAAERAGY